VESRFNICRKPEDGIHELTLQPKAESARRIMPQIKIAFETATFALHSTELQFATVRRWRMFFRRRVESKADEAMFWPRWGGLQITQPFKNNAPLRHRTNAQSAPRDD